MLLWYYIRALIKSAINTAPVAQLDRAFDYESKGCEFDSCPAHHYRDVAQLGSALDLGSRGHRFESCHPDHYYGEVAQLARAIGSYPEDRGFESHPRYHYLLSEILADAMFSDP